jgi:hypothetical protein
MRSNASLRVDVRNIRNLRGGGSGHSPVLDPYRRERYEQSILKFLDQGPGGGNLDPEDNDNYCDIPDIGLVQPLFQQSCVDFKAIVAPRVYPSVPRIDGASGNSHLLFETLVTAG